MKGFGTSPHNITIIIHNIPWQTPSGPKNPVARNPVALRATRPPFMASTDSTDPNIIVNPTIRPVSCSHLLPYHHIIMSTPPAPLLTLTEIRSDLATLARNPSLLDPFLPSPSPPTTSVTETPTTFRIDPTVAPANAQESLAYAAGVMRSARQGVLRISGGAQVEEVGRRLEQVKEEVDGLATGLEGH